jgi:hypothetical protein
LTFPLGRTVQDLQEVTQNSEELITIASIGGTAKLAFVYVHLQEFTEIGKFHLSYDDNLLSCNLSERRSKLLIEKSILLIVSAMASYVFGNEKRVTTPEK